MGLYFQGQEAQLLFDLLEGFDTFASQHPSEYTIRSYPKSGVINQTIEFSGIMIYEYFNTKKLRVGSKVPNMIYVVDLRSAKNAWTVLDFAQTLIKRSQDLKASRLLRERPTQINLIVRKILNRGLPAVREAHG
jgi:hypothetical protein